MLPNKNLTITLFISISIALLFFYFGTPAQWNLKTDRFKTQKSPSEIEKPEYQVTNLVSKKFDPSGKLHSTLYAEKLDFFNSTRLSKLYHPKFDLFTNAATNETNITHWFISSLEANSISPNDLVTLTGNIEVKKGANGSRAELDIFSESMLLDLTTNTITSDEAVTIVSEGNKIEGKQFAAELDRNYLQLKTNVKSRYQRSTPSQQNPSAADSDIIYISSQRFILEELEHRATYEGSVKLKQAQVTIDADKIVLIKRGAEQLVYAYGNPAYFKQKSKQEKDIDAQALRFEYNSLDKKVKMYEQARLKQGQAIFEGAYIFYDTQTESVGAESKADTRVKMVLPSKTSTLEIQKTPE